LIDGDGKMLAKVPLELRPQTKVNAKTSAQLDTDEDNDSEDNDSAAIAPKETIAVQSTPKTLVKKTVQSAPTTPVKKLEKPASLFPTVVVKVKKSDELSRPRVVPNK
jgi:hypothetical protein